MNTNPHRDIPSFCEMAVSIPTIPQKETKKDISSYLETIVEATYNGERQWQK